MANINETGKTANSKENIVKALHKGSELLLSLIPVFENAQSIKDISEPLKQIGNLGVQLWNIPRQAGELFNILGQVVKLKKQLKIELYHYQLKNKRYKYYEAGLGDPYRFNSSYGYEMAAFVIPKGTLGIITSKSNSGRNHVYKVAFLLPSSKTFNPRINSEAVELDLLDFNLTPEEKEIINPYRFKYVATRTGDNLKALEVLKKSHKL